MRNWNPDYYKIVDWVNNEGGFSVTDEFTVAGNILQTFEPSTITQDQLKVKITPYSTPNTNFPSTGETPNITGNIVTISIVPEQSTATSGIKNGDNILSLTAFSNLSTLPSSTGFTNDDISSTLDITQGDRKVTIGSASTQVLLGNSSQEKWSNLHRLTWFSSSQQFNGELEIMKLDLGARPSGTMDIFYGDGKPDTNATFPDYGDKKWTVTFNASDVTISSTQEEISPLKNYYVSNPQQNTLPYFDIKDSNGKLDNSSETLSLYKGVTYQFERNVDGSHPFSIRGNGVGVELPAGVVLLNEPLSASGDKLLLYVPPTYSGGNLEYHCTVSEHVNMKGTITFQDQTTTDPGQYDALVNSDRHLEGGQNIHLEVDGEEIKL